MRTTLHDTTTRRVSKYLIRGLVRLSVRVDRSGHLNITAASTPRRRQLLRLWVTEAGYLKYHASLSPCLHLLVRVVLVLQGSGCLHEDDGRQAHDPTHDPQTVVFGHTLLIFDSC